MKTKNIVYIVGLSLIGYLAYEMFLKEKLNIDLIISSGNFGVGKSKSDARKELKNFDKSFLKAWSDAIKNKQDTFTYLSKTFNVKGGRAKQ